MHFIIGIHVSITEYTIEVDPAAPTGVLDVVPVLIVTILLVRVAPQPYISHALMLVGTYASNSAMAL